MSLRWFMTDVEDYEKLAESQEEREITEVLVWLMFSIDIGRIDEKKIPEIMRRIRIDEELDGFRLWEKKADGTYEKVPFTEEMVRRRIGMWTNIVTATRKAFDAKVAKVRQRMVEDITSR